MKKLKKETNLLRDYLTGVFNNFSSIKYQIYDRLSGRFNYSLRQYGPGNVSFVLAVYGQLRVIE